MNFSTVETQLPEATDANVSEDVLAVNLTDGRTISVPVAWYPRLSHGTSVERSHWLLIGNGRGIHWLNLHLAVLAGVTSVSSTSNLTTKFGELVAGQRPFRHVSNVTLILSMAICNAE